MNIKFDMDLGYWAIPFGFGVQHGFLWFGFLCFNWDVTWPTNR